MNLEQLLSLVVTATSIVIAALSVMITYKMYTLRVLKSQNKILEKAAIFFERQTEMLTKSNEWWNTKTSELERVLHNSEDASKVELRNMLAKTKQFEHELKESMSERQRIIGQLQEQGALKSAPLDTGLDLNDAALGKLITSVHELRNKLEEALAPSKPNPQTKTQLVPKSS
jgi:ElaB/YqjD/DUF883 family membrane-anchored ribosome-binding protein